MSSLFDPFVLSFSLSFFLSFSVSAVLYVPQVTSESFYVFRSFPVDSLSNSSLLLIKQSFLFLPVQAACDINHSFVTGRTFSWTVVTGSVARSVLFHPGGLLP